MVPATVLELDGLDGIILCVSWEWFYCSGPIKPRNMNFSVK